MNLDFWPKPAGDGRRFAAAIGAGLLLELGALGLLLPAMSHKETPATTPAPVKLSIVAPAPTPTPTPPTPTPEPPKPVTPPPPPAQPPLPMAPPMPPPPPRPAAHHVTHRAVAPRPKITPPPAPAQPQPQAQAQPQQPVAQKPPPPAAPPAPSGGQVDAFSAAIKSALQAHANQVYPRSAQLAHETGEPVLTFTYLNGAVTGITLTRSSGFPLLDEAALEDARIAAYPPPPAGFQGRTYHITVAVTFEMAAPDLSAD
ncbi:MAG TPA: TonB family protein [Acidocella sp.]|nr:TonB family protein [Acidocella sp.]